MCHSILPEEPEIRRFGVILTTCRAQSVADSVMYRKALAAAAEARGWGVHWYDGRKIFDAASEALRIQDLEAHFLQLRKSIGPPWGKDHKLAMAAAIVAARAH
jgi:hypothetical protein